MSPAMRAVVVVTVLVSFGLMFTYAGPYRWIAELQLAHFGSYSEQLTVMATAAIVGLPMFAITSFLNRAKPPGVTHASAFALLVESRLARTGAILAVLGVGGAGWFTYDLATVGERSEADLAAIEAGQEPRTRWVVLHGELRHDLALGVSEGSRTTHYIPLVSSATSAPVVYLEVDDYGLASPELASGTYEGILYANDLPGMLRTQLEGREGEPTRHFRLDWRATPSDLEIGFYGLGVLGVFGLALVAVAFVWTRIR